MIIDRQWNKKEQKLVISYVDKLGNRQFYQKYLHHFKTYEYDPDGDCENWDGRKCKKVYKDTLEYTPNEFDILEYMYEMDPEMNKLFHAQYFPKLYTWDIETEVSLEFPDPQLAEQKVTSISLVGPDMSCIVYGLHRLTEEQIALLRKRYLDWIENNEFASNYKRTKLNNKEPKVLYQYFETEEDMLKHFFTKILPHVPALAGWNSYRFDWLYLWNRIVRLFGKGEAYNMIRKASPTGEIGKVSWAEQDGTKYSVPSPLHVGNFDYMEIVKQYDYALRPYESYGLDWVGNAAVKAHKIKYEGTLQQLYERDPEWYYFYNGIDSLIVNLIHKRLKSLESPCAVGSVTLVPLQAAFGQVALTTANVFWTFYSDGKHVVYDYDSIERTQVNYEGAFCGCVPGRYEWNVCDDFASLYPSQIQTCNLSFENFVYNKVGPDSFGRYTIIPWTEAELEEKRKDPNYFVTIMGNVYKNDQDYCFKKMQRRTKQNRDKYKYTGQRLESELLTKIEHLINDKEDDIKFSEDIQKIIVEHFNNVDLYLLSKDELNHLKDEVIELRQEYSLLELAMKTLGNAAYGAAANRFFYFYNIALAGDITGECRNLTKTMWHNLEEWFHEGIWERKDIWKQFDFELDESKHDWYRKQAVSIYSDTDSTHKNSFLLIKDNKNIKNKVTIESLFNQSYDKFGLIDITQNNQEIVQCDSKILNWTKENGLQYVPIKYIMRHKVSKAQFKINTKSGKEIIVTGDHSCIVFRNGEQLIIKAKDINKDTDRILSIYNINNYIIEEIKSIEQLENFNDEYVYDIEVDDDSHTFIANDILVHNSVYTTFGTFFDVMTEESQAKYNTDRKKLDWILKYSKEFQDKLNNKWCDEMYNPRHGHNIHEFELETVSKAGIYLKKKKYLKGLVFNKGKYLDKPKVSGTGIELIKSTTPKLCRKILSDLMESLMFDYDEKKKSDYILEFNMKLQNYRNEFYKAPIEDISQSIGVGNYKKYVINDEDDFELGKQCPVSVQAIARFNYLAHKNNEDNKKQYAGKIKYYNIRINEKLNGYFGFPAGELPDWAPKMDKLTQWEKTVIDPINRFLEVMNIPLANPVGAVQLDLFGSL